MTPQAEPLVFLPQDVILANDVTGAVLQYRLGPQFLGPAQSGKGMRTPARPDLGTSGEVAGSTAIEKPRTRYWAL